MAKSVITFILAIVVSILVSATARAAATPSSKITTNVPGGFSLTPTVGGYLFAESEKRDPAQTYGIKAGYDSVGKLITDSIGVEGSFNYVHVKSKTDGSDAAGYLFHLDAIYPFSVKGKWLPIFALGAGVICIDTPSGLERTPLVSYGAGLKYFLEDYLAMRVDARHHLIYKDADTRSNYEIGVGLSYYFGKERKKMIETRPVSKPVNSKDGK